MSKIYRLETWLPKEQAWKIEGYCSEYEDAAVMRLALTLKGDKFAVTTIDLDDILERDAICSYLTEYMRERHNGAKALEAIERMIEATTDASVKLRNLADH